MIISETDDTKNRRGSTGWLPHLEKSGYLRLADGECGRRLGDSPQRAACSGERTREGRQAILLGVHTLVGRLGGRAHEEVPETGLREDIPRLLAVWLELRAQPADIDANDVGAIALGAPGQ